MMNDKYIILPFTEFDSAYLESLPDEVFFARRFQMSAEDKEILEENSSVVNGRRFYRAKILNPILEKYAVLTNPKEGEPGSRSNPLIRYGKAYVYNSKGNLVLWIANQNEEALTESQIEMIHKAAKMPIVYDSDCPKSTRERLDRFRRYGQIRNQQRTERKIEAYQARIQSM